MEILERDFRVHIKVHEQKAGGSSCRRLEIEVQNLEYEHKEAKRQVADTGENDLQKELGDPRIPCEMTELATRLEKAEF